MDNQTSGVCFPYPFRQVGPGTRETQVVPGTRETLDEKNQILHTLKIKIDEQELEINRLNDLILKDQGLQLRQEPEGEVLHLRELVQRFEKEELYLRDFVQSLEKEELYLREWVQTLENRNHECNKRNALCIQERLKFQQDLETQIIKYNKRENQTKNMLLEKDNQFILLMKAQADNHQLLYEIKCLKENRNP